MPKSFICWFLPSNPLSSLLPKLSVFFLSAATVSLNPPVSSVSLATVSVVLSIFFESFDIILENFPFLIAKAVVTPNEASATAELTYVRFFNVLSLFEKRGGVTSACSLLSFTGVFCSCIFNKFVLPSLLKATLKTLLIGKLPLSCAYKALKTIFC